MNEAQQILELLFANLLDEKQSKVGLMMEHSITEDLIPKEWRWHKAIMKAFYEAERLETEPTPANIALLSKLPDQKGVLEKLIKLQGSAGQHSILACAIFFKGWASNKQFDEVLADIGNMAGVEYGDVNEKKSLAVDKLLASISLEGATSHTRLSIIESFEAVQKKRVEFRELGQALGPVLHLEELRRLIPVLQAGDVTLLTAPPKSGKTQFTMEVAEFNAIYNNTDVLVLLLETNITIIEERMLAKYLHIPSRALKDGRVDLSKEPFKSKHEAYKKLQEEHWNERGRVYLQYVAGARLSTISAQIRVHKRLSEARNRPLLVIIDYLQRIPEVGGKTTVESIAVTSNGIKDMATNYETHIALLSQESFSGVNKEQGESRAHGSNTPIFVAQNHIALRVLNSIEDIYVTDEDGNILKNAVGEDRYYQRKGSKNRQSVIRYDVIRANNDEPGIAYALLENPLFSMLDISSEEALYNLPPLFQRQVETFDMDLLSQNRRLI